MLPEAKFVKTIISYLYLEEIKKETVRGQEMLQRLKNLRKKTILLLKGYISKVRVFWFLAKVLYGRYFKSL